MDLIEARAPGRAEWLGNHTDYNGGLVLAVGIAAGATVRGALRPDDRIRVEASDLGRRWEGTLSTLGPCPGEPWTAYVAGVADGLQRRGITGAGFDLVVQSTVPRGAGLSSSAALACATARFLQEAWKTSFPVLELARIAQEAEHRFAGVPCGLLDPMTSLHAAEGHAVFLDCRSLRVQLLRVPPEALFILAPCGNPHTLGDGAYRQRREECERACRGLGLRQLRDATAAAVEEAGRTGVLQGPPLRRALHVVGENARVAAAVAALGRGDLADVGRLMLESHASSRDLFENSCPELDFLVSAATALPGCWGARLTGGGFGGATINLVEASRAAEFTGALTEAFARRYSRGISCFTTPAAGGSSS